MASMWRQAMLYLGLGPDEEYDDKAEQVPGGYRAPEPEAPVDIEVDDSSVTLLSEHEPVRAMPVGVGPEPVAEPAPTAPAVPDQASALAGAGIEPTGSVRTIPVSSAKPHVVAPHSFNDAQQVADRFKADQPIIVNLQDVDRDLSRRIIDFTSGLCYALNGNMEKVADSVYLLAPSNVSLPDEERQRLQERGLHY